VLLYDDTVAGAKEAVAELVAAHPTPVVAVSHTGIAGCAAEALTKALAQQPEARSGVYASVAASRSRLVAHGRFAYDATSFECYLDGTSIDGLQVTQRKLLGYCVQHKGRVVRRAALLADVFDPSGQPARLDWHVNRLRAALGEAGCLLRTEIGVGFLLLPRAKLAP
jgi:DNA-binding response OmpR family regulator